MSEEQKSDASVPVKRKGVTVQASPFNGVKLELAVILLLAIIVWILVDKLVVEGLAQLWWLGGFGLASMLWLFLRIHVLKRRLHKRGTHEFGQG